MVCFEPCQASGVSWVAQYDDNVDSYGKFSGIAVDQFGQIYVTGTNIEGDTSIITTLKYTDIAVSVREERGSTPMSFALAENYPNPFNPSTTIRYELPQKGFVTLKVYNLLGQEVATIVNQKPEAGSYQVQFDGTGLASGVYFYRVKAGDYVESKKLLLLN